MNDAPTVLVALDPSSDWGEAALEFAKDNAHATGRRFTLFVSLSGPSAHALREFAVAEGLSVAEAAEVYLEQVIDRLESQGFSAEAISAMSYDAADDLLAHVRERAVSLLAVPAGGRIVSAKVLDALATSAGVPLVVVPTPATAAA